MNIRETILETKNGEYLIILQMDKQILTFGR